MKIPRVFMGIAVVVFSGVMVTSLSGQGRPGGYRGNDKTVKEKAAKKERHGFRHEFRHEDNTDEGQRLFEEETFGGNGRTCLTCHSRKTGTVSPRDAQKRFQANANDPLFLHDGSD